MRPTIVAAEPPRLLHWHGEVGRPGVFDTDHTFEIQEISAHRVRFVQREEFRGTHAGAIDDAAKASTRAAFRAMNEFLAARAEGR